MNKHAFREIQKKLKLTNEGVSEAIDVELFTVQNWASGNWPIPQAMAKFLRTLLSAQRDMTDVYMSGYYRGRNNGSGENYTTGYNKGYNKGYQEGCAVGQRRGEQKGYVDGYSAGLDVGIF